MKFFEKKSRLLFKKRDRYDLATRLRRFEMHFVSGNSKRMQIKWRQQRYDESRKGFSILQREVFLKEDVEARLKLSRTQPLTDEQAKQLRDWQKELETFDQKYWLHRRALYKLILEKPKGPWVREWDACSRREAVLSLATHVVRCKGRLLRT